MDAEGFRRLEQSCVDEGLLARGRFTKRLRITKKGRELVKAAAVVDDEVRAALEAALDTPLLERERAFAVTVLVARQRLDER